MSGGYNYSCGVATDSIAYCWGANAFGIGSASTSGSLTPVPVDKVTRAAAISVGYSHACALGSDGAIYCWGDNAVGAIGNGAMPNPQRTPVRVANVSGFASVDTGFDFTCGVTRAREAYCWGQRDNGTERSNSPALVADPAPALPRELPVTFASLSAGHYLSCGVTSWAPR